LTKEISEIFGLNNLNREKSEIWKKYGTKNTRGGVEDVDDKNDNEEEEHLVGEKVLKRKNNEEEELIGNREENKKKSKLVEKLNNQNNWEVNVKDNGENREKILIEEKMTKVVWEKGEDKKKRKQNERKSKKEAIKKMKVKEEEIEEAKSLGLETTKNKGNEWDRENLMIENNNFVWLFEDYQQYMCVTCEKGNDKNGLTVRGNGLVANNCNEGVKYKEQKKVKTNYFNFKYKYKNKIKLFLI
jgi:hypothetical protein